MAGRLTIKMFGYILIACLYLITMPCHSSDAEMRGHMEKLGMQRESQGHIEVLKELPSPVEFFEKYIEPGKPVVFKDAAKKMPAFKNWNDKYLR